MATSKKKRCCKNLGDNIDPCAGTNKPGFLVCINGQTDIINDYPATGGPWGPVIQIGPNGPLFTWKNQAGNQAVSKQARKLVAKTKKKRRKR